VGSYAQNKLAHSWPTRNVAFPRTPIYESLGARGWDIAIVSPNTVHRKGLCALLGQNKDFRAVVDAGSALDSYEEIRKAHPQILLMETTDSSSDLETVCRLRKLLPETRILLLIDRAGETFEVRALKQEPGDAFR